MSSIIQTNSYDSNFLQWGWSMVAPYYVFPVAASVAIIPVFRDMAAKSAQQIGRPIPRMTFMEGIRGGIKVAPTVGALVGMQMAFQSLLENAMTSDEKSLSSKFFSSAIVGAGSSLPLAVLNGQTMGWTVREACRKISARQCLAITVQETAFVAGLSVIDPLAEVMRKQFGNHKSVDYAAAFFAGAVGSLVGHPANTALTRWQCGMKIEHVRQLMRGSLRKARAVGGFSVFYKLGKEVLNSAVSAS